MDPCRDLRDAAKRHKSRQRCRIDATLDLLFSIFREGQSWKGRIGGVVLAEDPGSPRALGPHTSTGDGTILATIAPSYLVEVCQSSINALFWPQTAYCIDGLRFAMHSSMDHRCRRRGRLRAALAWCGLHRPSRLSWRGVPRASSPGVHG